ncbi:hypothetical protein ASG43_01330 [Aureimonas sp. Leaf454]|uniref:PhzF family phenazine biosynthesis protein n=1 Tax=Aureimonas sp. Leaf454 TaxID=1736381 RepID=UPI0007001D9D|nr:PhzF family phenazine biosynthesis protein [Aureimonas sp. Leaf454]KQT54291.1 hypothetical protein ASG43_01330 [Aureimonas sp. Leaf454]
MLHRRFVQCDVFSPTPLKGNGLAVVLDGAGLTDRKMQDFAAWTQLAETTFVLPPVRREADYRIRIFTPNRELDFAGHPTLGTCAAWLNGGGRPRRAGTVLQEGNLGLVSIDLGQALPAFVAPKTDVADMPRDIRSRIVAGLDIDERSVTSACVLANGSVWHLLELADAATLMAVQAERAATLPGLAIGLLAPSRPGAASQYDVRMLAARTARFEDPITGSLNAAIGMWLRQDGRLTHPIVMAQGEKVGRDGQVHLMPGAAGTGEVLVGGRTHILIEGSVFL